MESENDSAVLAYIRHVLDSLQISPSALAKLAGISSTTLTRPLNNPGHKFNLSATTIEKIAGVSGINPAAIFANKDHPTRLLSVFFDKNMYDPDKWRDENQDHISVVIVGYAGLGMWHENGITFSDYIGSVPVAPIFYAPADSFAVIIQDYHAGEFAFQGDTVVCVRTKALKHEPADGSVVLLERRKEGGRLLEFTVRKLHKTNNGWNLNTLAVNRRGYHQLFLESLDETDENSIAGLVVCSVRYP